MALKLKDFLEDDTRIDYSLYGMYYDNDKVIIGSIQQELVFSGMKVLIIDVPYKTGSSQVMKSKNLVSQTFDFRKTESVV